MFEICKVIINNKHAFITNQMAKADYHKQAKTDFKK